MKTKNIKFTVLSTIAILLSVVLLLPQTVSAALGSCFDCLVYSPEIWFDNEGPSNLFDDDVNTKWCIPFDNVDDKAVVVWRTTVGVNISGYLLTTADDNDIYPGRNPHEWSLYGSVDGSEWILLSYIYDSKNSLSDKNHTTYNVYLNKSQKDDEYYQYFKFEVLSTAGAEELQLSELHLMIESTKEIPLSDRNFYKTAEPVTDNAKEIEGTVIGNIIGWSGSAFDGTHAAFDGDISTYFDPLGVGDGFCGIESNQKYILSEVAIHSRLDLEERLYGAEIQGSNDGENWTTLCTINCIGYPDYYYHVTKFENNTGYFMYRYYNNVKHGDVAELVFYGYPVETLTEAAEVESIESDHEIETDEEINKGTEEDINSIDSFEYETETYKYDETAVETEHIDSEPGTNNFLTLLKENIVVICIIIVAVIAIIILIVILHKLKKNKKNIKPEKKKNKKKTSLRRRKTGEKNKHTSCKMTT